jgi:hypothetical protein
VTFLAGLTWRDGVRAGTGRTDDLAGCGSLAAAKLGAPDPDVPASTPAAADATTPPAATSINRLDGRKLLVTKSPFLVSIF